MPSVREFKSVTSCRVLIPAPIVDRLELTLKNARGLETGGFLIGLRRGHDIELSNLTLESRGDIATPTTFTRKSASHRQFIIRSWNQSGGLESLVGDWHTHPRGSGTPSQADMGAWQQLSSSKVDPAVGIILAQKRFRVFVSKKNGRRLAVKELSIVERSDNDIVYGLS